MVEAKTDNHQILQNAKRSLEQDPQDATGMIRKTILTGLIKTKAFEEGL